MTSSGDAPGSPYQRGQAPVSADQPGMAPTAEYPAVADPAPSGAPAQPSAGAGSASAAGSGRGGGFPRTLFWLAATVAVVLAIVVGVREVGLWPRLTNPFASQQNDRSQPVLLKSIQDLSRFVAAEGNFEVIVDLQNNTKYVPEFLVSDRTLFVAAGTVEAYVEFGGISQDAIQVSADRRIVEIKLPAPVLGKPNIDNNRSYVYATQKGLLNRIGELFKDDPNRMQEIYRLAEEKIGASATGSGLADRAKENTSRMLEGMLRALGYDTVTVMYAAP